MAESSTAPERPLLARYPALAGSPGCVPLLDAPTPVERFSPAADADGPFANLWIKRDDRTSALYGGNKVRKLEFILADVRASGKRRVVTFGALGTNHGVATSTFCRQAGLDCRILLFDQPVTPVVSANLRQMIANGAQLHYCGGLLATALQFYARQLIDHRDYCLPAGGSSPVGCLGFVNAAFELRQQIEDGLLPDPDVIVCAVGSSGTLAGLTLGCHLAGLKARVQGVRVTPSHVGPVPVCTAAGVGRLLRRTANLLATPGLEPPGLPAGAIELDGSYYGAGYGSATPEGTAAMRLFGERGIALESTYTAKAAAAALQLCREQPSRTVLYWHTYCAVDDTIALSPSQLVGLDAHLSSVAGYPSYTDSRQS